MIINLVFTVAIAAALMSVVAAVVVAQQAGNKVRKSKIILKPSPPVLTRRGGLY